MTRADAPGAKRTLELDAEDEAEEPVADGRWPVRAWLSLRARAGAARSRAQLVVLAAATAAIDKCIALLQRLRQRAEGAQQEDEGRGLDDAGERPGEDALERRGKPGSRAQSTEEPADEESVAPKPRRRLRSLLVYLSVLLAGGMGGTALAYDLLARLLDQRSAEVSSQQLKLSKFSKSMAQLKQKLEEGQAKQSELEARLATVLAENETKIGELQQKRAEAEKRLASALAGRASSSSWRQEDSGSSAGPDRQAGLSSTGDCTLGSGNIQSVLSGCIAEMNRR
ncbi:MAG: hypothetical protein IH605_16995 [Burkholderiales bacterium]|nr:hypothetical protein [Burkholderiales bacterium]